MPPIHDIRGVFEIWASLAEMSRETGIEYQTVAKWAQRKRIPPESFPAVRAAAKRRGRRLSDAQLNRLNTPRATANQPAVAG